MKKMNTMTKKEYIFENILWSFISMIWYRRLFFCRIPNMNNQQSKLLLWAILFLFVFLGILITYVCRRNYTNLIINLTLPYEVYTLIAYKEEFTFYIKIICSFTFLFTLIYVYDRMRKKNRIMKKIYQCLYGSRTIIATCFVLLIVPIGIHKIFGNVQLFHPKISENTIYNNMEIMPNLLQDHWETLSIDEKKETLQAVANIETWYLGLPHELNVTFETLDKYVIAEYRDSKHLIVVNLIHLNLVEAEDILEAVLHESYHAYQHRLCDIYDHLDDSYKNMIIFEIVQNYKEEFNEYNDGKNDYDGYYYQKCEINARAYAKEGVKEYYQKINQYSHHNNTP